jgi:hypothetical protein
MINTDKMLFRSGEPTKYDQSPYGTICKRVKSLTDKFEIYVQMSKNDCCPLWEKVGMFSPETESLIEEEVNKILNIKKHL